MYIKELNFYCIILILTYPIEFIKEMFEYKKNQHILYARALPFLIREYTGIIYSAIKLGSPAAFKVAIYTSAVGLEKKQGYSTLCKG